MLLRLPVVVFFSFIWTNSFSLSDHLTLLPFLTFQFICVRFCYLVSMETYQVAHLYVCTYLYTCIHMSQCICLPKVHLCASSVLLKLQVLMLTWTPPILIYTSWASSHKNGLRSLVSHGFTCTHTRAHKCSQAPRALQHRLMLSWSLWWVYRDRWFLKRLWVCVCISLGTCAYVKHEFHTLVWLF